MTKLRISPDLSLPEEVVTEAFAILAKRGVGKTYTGSVMVEEMLKARLQVAVVDPLGVWWGLRSSADGKEAGFPVLILGGQHGDVPLEPGEASGKLIADLLVEERLSAVLDLSLFSKDEMRTLVTAFAERLFRAKATHPDPLHLMVDEADMFLPQRYPAGPTARMIGAFNDLVLKGRVRGLGSTLITQRSAKINKDVLTQVEILLTMRITHPRDRVPIEEWVSEHGDAEGWKRMLGSLHQLPVGTAWVWWGTEHLLQEIRIRARETFDSSATPKVGQRLAPPKTVADVDLGALQKRMATTIEKAKAEDPRELRRQIAALKKDLDAAQKRLPAAVSEAAARVERVEVPVEVSVLTEADRLWLKEAMETFARSEQLLQEVSENIHGASSAVDDALRAAEQKLKERIPGVGRSNRKVEPARAEQVARARPERLEARPTPRLRDEDGELPVIKAGAKRMVQVLIRHYPMKMTRAQLGTLAKVKRTGGTFSDYFSRLKTSGLIEETDGFVEITQAGLDYIGHVPAEPITVEELREMYRSALKAGARRMLDVLIEEGGNWISRQELADRAEITMSGGTFSDYLSSLRTNGLADVAHRMVRASETLFIGAEL